MDCLYFGCWNQSGHYLFLPGGQSAHRQSSIELYGGAERIHLDGSLAPRKINKSWLANFGKLCWQGQGKTNDERLRTGYDSEEYPQGQFLLHHLNNGYTAIQWWDRCQGDTRGACNSTILLKGVHTSAEMLAALQQYFPHVLANLKKAGVELVEVEAPKVPDGE